MTNSTEEIYMFNLHFPNFSRDEVLQASRTLSDKPILLNGRKLRYPQNKVFHAEYNKKTDEIQIIREGEISKNEILDRIKNG